MARDTEKYAYFTIGILKDSETYRLLLLDAANSSKPGEVSAVIAMRIGDYYQGIRPVEESTKPDMSPQEEYVRILKALAKFNVDS